MTTTTQTASTSPRRLRRRAHGRVLGGVCGGVADLTGADVAVIRLVTVLLALVSGVGIALYLAAWVLLPVQGAERSPVEARFEH